MSASIDFANILEPAAAAEGEWWYYHGRLEGDGARYAFHLAFFRRWTRDIRFVGGIPAAAFNDQIWFVHFTVSELDAGLFHYTHRRAFFRRGGGAEASRRRVWLGACEARAARGTHWLRAVCGPVRLALALRSEKPIVDHGNGEPVARSARSATRYLTAPRLAAHGRLRIGGRWVRVAGMAWLDREWGILRPDERFVGWDWFGIQLRDGRELMISRIRDAAGRPTPYSTATLIAADGRTTRLGPDGFAATPRDAWTSPRTGARYPRNWTLSIPAWKMELDIAPILPCQELDTAGTTNVVYWEGAAEVTGLADGRAVTGTAFVELTGYALREGDLDRLERLLRNVGLADLALNEWQLLRWRLRGARRSCLWRP